MSVRILAAQTALPPHYVDQETLLAAFRAAWGKKHFNLERLEQLHRAVRVGGRHLALPLDEYIGLESFAARNAAWTRVAVDVGEQAVRNALLAADVAPSQVDHLFFVTVTGIATPSIDARLVERLGLRSDVRRVPIFGLGCVAGAAGLARVNDVLRGAGSETAVLL
ncbi:MAG TPA: type III polyketide synthase, partial [Myxococcales bacterium]|nr:type III polyketide synthase [Myxococcales bacterium]